MDPRSAREVLFEIVTVEVTFIEETTGGFLSSGVAICGHVPTLTYSEN